MQTCTSYKCAPRTLPLFEACGYNLRVHDRVHFCRVRAKARALSGLLRFSRYSDGRYTVCYSPIAASRDAGYPLLQRVLSPLLFEEIMFAIITKPRNNQRQFLENGL